jgi:glutamyl-tRNA synthetase
LIKENLTVRVRFAPSPTGNLHIGGLRTALFNYLFSSQHGGKFILRIDDTDKARSKKEYEDSIIKDLKWFDIKWDEFYRQSERNGIYEECLSELRKKGFVYECFCSEEEILKSKEIAIKSKKPYIYNGRCANLSPAEKENLRFSLKEKGLTPSIRLNIAKVLSADSDFNLIEFNDAVHGRLVFNAKLIGDFILKTESDRFAYNFASAIDDSDTGITHVIRGEDHISNTPKQIIILKALGKEPPVFAHVSLLYGSDGKIMSKRDAASNIEYYKKEGYLPEAVLNYLAVIGNTFAVRRFKDGKEEIFEKEIFSGIVEMQELFDIKKAKSSSAIFNEDKLKFINEKHLAAIPAENLIKILSEKFQAVEILLKLKEAYGENKFVEIIDFLKKEFKTVKEILKEIEIFFGSYKIDINEVHCDCDYELKSALLCNIKNVLEFNDNSLKKLITETASENNKTIKECYETLRFFITGRLDGPSILKIIKFLGKKIVIDRLSV